LKEARYFYLFSFIGAVGLIFWALAWHAADIPINWVSDTDAHVHPYHKNCDFIAEAYFKGRSHVRLPIDEYQRMVAELKACTARQTPEPVARR
jgi:hypothetical protein